MWQGAIHLEKGDNHVALEAFLRAEELLSSCSEHMRAALKGMVYFNLGLTYRHLRKPVTALECYRIALAEFETEGILENRVRTAHNTAWIHLFDMNDAPAAREILEEVDHLDPPPVVKTHQYIYMALTVSQMQNYPEADALFQLAEKALPSLPAGRGTSQAYACYCLAAGTHYLALGSAHVALTFAAECHRAAIDSGDTRLMTLACNLRAMAMETQAAGD